MNYLISFLLVLSYSLPGQAALVPDPDVQDAGTDENPHQIPAIDTPVVIDGLLDEEAWKHALQLSLPWEYWPGDNTPAPVKTEFLLMYDGKRIYAGFRCYDPDPSRISAHYLNRDQIWNDDDWIRIWLETFNDNQKSFVLGCNALGVQGDGTWANSDLDWSWDAIWDSAGVIHDWGYSIELSIPFNQLTFRQSDGQRVWGITAERCYPRDAWRVLGMFEFDGNLDRWLFALPRFEGFTGVSPGRNLEVNPTITSVHTDERQIMPDGSFAARDRETDVGATVRWGVTPDITFNGTFNPDFSQVEADALQLDINEPFTLGYPEKRQFFTEGAEYFATRINAVYTRSFRDPSLGLKMIGKMQSNTFGAYLVNDEFTNVIFPGKRSSRKTTLQTENWASVMRYQREFNDGNYIGILSTNREGEDYYNRLLAVDGKFLLSKTDSFLFEAFGTVTRYPDDIAVEFDQAEGEFSDTAFYARYRRDARSFDVGISYMDIGRDFRADVGFVPQVDIRRFHIVPSYKWLPKASTWYRRLILGADAKAMYDHAGNLILWQAGPSFNYRGPKHIEAEVTWGVIQEVYNQTTYDQNRIDWQFSMKPTDNHMVSFNGTAGDRIDYANARAGKRLRLESSITSHIGRHLRLSLDHSFERLTVDAGRLYTASISQLSALYKFNRQISFRTMLQYIDYRRDVDLYRNPIEAEFKHLFTQLLFSYQLNPRSVLYIGYSDNHYGNTDYDITQKDRTLFVKLGYAWMF